MENRSWVSEARIIALGDGRAGRGWKGSDQVLPNKRAKAKVTLRQATLFPASGLPEMLAFLPETIFTQSSGLCLHVTSSILSLWAQLTL